MPVWPWLAGVVMVLFLADVALRRLVLVSGAPDLAHTASGDSRRSRRPDYVDDPPPETEQPGPSTETLGRLLDRRRKE